jgi:glycosyltransferase involved in cell wall biosynthesis
MVAPELSVVIPVLNEADNIQPLQEELTSVLDRTGIAWQVIAVDDGSSDGSFERLCEAHARDPRWRVIRFRRNFGQTAAFSAGFAAASSPVVITMDADMQNDPGDIPRLLEVLANGFDVVSGWRVQRVGSWLRRRLPSRLANWVISTSTGVKLHDYGCSLKAYRAEILESIELYGELHRFIPAIASRDGARIAEIPVNDRERVHESSKYGLGRTFAVVLDLLTVFFLLGYGWRPLRFFGGVGLGAIVAGSAINLYLTVVKLAYGQPIADRPLLLLGLLLTIVGVQLVAIGLLAELVMRTYFAARRRPAYAIRERLGFDQ